MNVLFFSPYAAIWRHESLELQLARIFELRNHNVTFMRCRGALNANCVAMSAFGLNNFSSNQDKEEVCIKCRKSSSFLETVVGLSAVYIEDFLPDRYEKRVSEILESFDVNHWQDFVFDGIPIGRIAAYEFLLNNKVISAQIPKEIESELISAVRNVILTYLSLEQHFTKNKYDLVVFYNRLYGTNHLVSILAKRLGVKTYNFFPAGPIDDLYSRIVLCENDEFLFSANKSADWSDFSREQLTFWEYSRVRHHIKSLQSAKSPWVYSLARAGTSVESIRTRFGIPSKSKIYLLALSSADEVFAAQTIGIAPKAEQSTSRDIFVDQIDWISFILQHARDNEDSFFIIRVHPREFPNKREARTSQNALRLQEIASKTDLPNVAFNLPADQISLYDLIPCVDKILTGNSSAGIEFCMMGVPVVCHNPTYLTNYPHEIASIPESRSAYLDELSRVVPKEELLEKLLLAHKWMYFRTFHISRRIQPFYWKFFDLFLRGVLKYSNRQVLKVSIKSFKNLYFLIMGRRKSANVILKNLTLGQPILTIQKPSSRQSKSATLSSKFVSIYLSVKNNCR